MNDFIPDIQEVHYFYPKRFNKIHNFSVKRKKLSLENISLYRTFLLSALYMSDKLNFSENVCKYI